MATKVNPGPQAGEVVDFPGTRKYSPQMPYPPVGPRVRGDPQLSGVTSGEEGHFPGKAMELSEGTHPSLKVTQPDFQPTLSGFPSRFA